MIAVVAIVMLITTMVAKVIIVCLTVILNTPLFFYLL